VLSYISDTSAVQSSASFRTTPANGNILWACLTAARCVFWSLVNDCSRKIQCRSAPRLALLSVHQCVRVSVCARPAEASDAAALLSWKRVYISPTRRSARYSDPVITPREVHSFFSV